LGKTIHIRKNSSGPPDIIRMSKRKSRAYSKKTKHACRRAALAVLIDNDVKFEKTCVSDFELAKSLYEKNFIKELPTKKRSHKALIEWYEVNKNALVKCFDF